MLTAIDFSKYARNGKYYGGSERKEGISINGEDYMLKFQKKTAFGMRNNHISEFLGSHIFEICELETHKTYLGYRDGEEVVACKDFNVPGRQFVPFNDVGESTLDHDKEAYQYDYEDIMQMLSDNSKLTNVDETISMFWRIYVMDALLGNFDRHGANWGFIKENNYYTLAPVFDNGSCLFPNLVDEEEMQEIMESEEETDKRIYKSDGTSTILFHDKNYSNKLMYQEIKDLNIRFNLYDLERKIFILKEKELDEVKSELPKLNISRLDTIADSKIIVPDYDYNDIWRNI